ncbi:MAG: hypothetical protein HYZ17_15090 [Betaproteobacteria bacterium]|nr:hypothetical protein [Betaproteobacteria bacterium]
MTRWAARLATVATVLGLALLAWVLAFWIWRWLEPAAVFPPAAQVADPVQVLRDGALFGHAPRSTANSPLEAATAGAHRLLGVFAQSGGGGWALLKRADNSVRLLREGEEIQTGEKLDLVLPQGVEILQGGARHKLTLGRVDSDPRVGGGALSGPCPLSPEERRRAFYVRPELLSGIAQGLNGARKLFRQHGGAWVVAVDDPALAALGFEAGDRIERGNGVPLLSEDALRGAIVEPVLQSRVLRLSGQRKGKAREWIYANAALCSR